MKKKISIVLFGFLVLLPFFTDFATAANDVNKQTFIYSIKGNDTLRLDKYEIPDGSIKPCVIFAFGGGFFSGARDGEYYLPYFQFLVNEGFTVVSIDYRLGFKNVQDQNLNKAKDFIALFEKTIFMAVEDLFEATNFVLNNADAWKINKNMIIASGSSAGAITVLQGEYERCNRTERAKVLPADFKYAGVISFAGAIFSNRGHLKWKNTPAPLQLFHGDADSNVPYDKIKIFRLGFYGSKYIADQYERNKFPYYFYIEENADHKMAGEPMLQNQDEIRTFIRKYIIGKEPLSAKITVKPLNVPDVNKNFSIGDYIKTNFGG